MSCFFFKQKTAYEMRIIDWSSDVCSSDLRGAVDDQAVAAVVHEPGGEALGAVEVDAAVTVERRDHRGEDPAEAAVSECAHHGLPSVVRSRPSVASRDRKSTRLNSSH